MKATNSRYGFVLPVTLFLMALCTVAVATVLGYVSFTTRMTALHLGNSVCRLAAQSAIEATKSEIYRAFYTYSGGSSVRIGTMTGTAFNWFDSYSQGTAATATAPGTPSYIGSGTVVTLPGTTNINGCIVTPIVWHSERITGQPAAIVTLRATAVRENPGGMTSTSTIEERIRFALMRSRVFDNAYFVNNYGWFQGSSITANGDVRANGNLYLDSGCTVNGHAYAARNDELGVIGTIQNTGKMQSQSAYWSNCGSFARPTSPAYTGGDYYGGGYDTSFTVTERLHPYQDELTMPYISDLSEYIKYAQDSGGKLSGGISYKIDSNGNVTQSSLGTINAHYDGAGPSGNTSLSDKGALVLEGTASNPIVIDGPVVIDSDVVIRGYVKGQGTIYSGRNIHIVGTIQYVNGPTWSHPDTNPDATAAANASKDLLGLAAKGNIVMGDYTLSSWLGSSSSGLQYYLKNGPYVQKYICDESDKNIGYPRTTEYGWTSNESKFCGDYTQKDGGKKVNVTSTTQTVYDPKTRRYVQQTTTTIADSATRKYYESVCPEKLIQHLCADTQSSRGAYQPTITRIDAVMYNNHGIIGHIGNCTINGSLVCRNEAMIYEGGLKINWDHRLYSGLSGSMSNALGLPMDASRPPQTLSWREVSN
ncbi:MAG: hypothetical protein IKO72_07000 [Kiritimatiellae bacterium]|nr:hypothetical protein [Kiritimatiellia bacterium]